MKTIQKPYSQTQQQVRDLIAARGIVFECHCAGLEDMIAERPKQYKRYKFAVSFANQLRGTAEIFTYWQGSGHSARAANGEIWPTQPTSADVLYCLLNDSECAREHFADFCANYGYDEDSREAERIYKDCERTNKQLDKIFSEDLIDELCNLLQDY